MRKSCGQCRHYKVNRYLESICTLTGKNVGYLWPGEDSCFEPLSLPKPPTNDNKVEPNDNKLKPEAMETPDKKICKCCGRELTIEHFQPNPKCKDGHLDTCKECMNAKRESSRKRNLLGTAIPAPKEDATEKAIMDKLIENDVRMDENGTPKAHITSEKFLEALYKSDLVMYEDGTITMPLTKIKDEELVEELRSRGWTVRCTKVIEL